MYVLILYIAIILFGTPFQPMYDKSISYTPFLVLCISYTPYLVLCYVHVINDKS